jgi:two-component system cell cycle sensor histidine kinase PleC
VDNLMKGGSGSGDFLSPAKGKKVYTAYHSIQGPGWGILVNQPAAEIEQAVGNIKDSTLKVLLFALGVAGLLAMLVAHVLLEPITRIRLAAERLGNGNGDALIPATGLSSRLTEINDLRAAFNAMVLRIRKSQRTEIAARKEAQEANRTKSRFLANMSHELRTPLNAIIGFADVCKRRLDGPEHERDREYAGYIHDSGHHLLSIINDLLDLSRIEAGARKLDERDVNVSEAIREARAMLGTMAEDKGTTVELKGVDDGTLLWADPRAIKQILLNLATNAVRYTQDGGRIVIGCERAETGALTLFVADNGPGIDTEEIEHVRTPFTRGQTHENAAVPGTGLGLSIVEALADMHGARLDLVSEPGKGTRARVVFPPNRSLLMLDDDTPVRQTAAE